MEYNQPEIDDNSWELVPVVRAAQRGNSRALEKLVSRYERAVYATALRRLGNHADAQELSQEVFVQVFRKLSQLHDPRCFGAWLQAIVNRMAINRAMRRGPALVLDAQSPGADRIEEETPLQCAMARERREQVHEGLDRLRTLDRDTLVAFYFRGKSLIEMSDDFASPVGTIKRRLHVARKRLARELEALAPA